MGHSCFTGPEGDGSAGCHGAPPLCPHPQAACAGHAHWARAPAKCYADPCCIGSADVSREWRSPRRWARSQDHCTNTTVGNRCAAAEAASGIHGASAPTNDGSPDSAGSAEAIWSTWQAARTATAISQLTFTTGSEGR